jgi:hypothetical protein
MEDHPLPPAAHRRPHHPHRTTGPATPAEGLALGAGPGPRVHHLAPHPRPGLKPPSPAAAIAPPSPPHLPGDVGHRADQTTTPRRFRVDYKHGDSPVNALRESPGLGGHPGLADQQRPARGWCARSAGEHGEPRRTDGPSVVCPWPRKSPHWWLGGGPRWWPVRSPRSSRVLSGAGGPVR